jgi:glutaconyl-CoA/methylmalonyl-CoA decarboxylase subunit gamma
MRRYRIAINGTEYVVDVQELSADRFQVALGTDMFEVQLVSDQNLSEAQITPQIAPLASAAANLTPDAVTGGAAPVPAVPAAPAPAPALPAKPMDHRAAASASTLNAPMPGVLLEVVVAPGDRVSRGQVVAVLEAMKMRNEIKAPRDGVVAAIFVQPGQLVAYGDPLVRVEEA